MLNRKKLEEKRQSLIEKRKEITSNIEAKKRELAQLELYNISLRGEIKTCNDILSDPEMFETEKDIEAKLKKIEISQKKEKQ